MDNDCAARSEARSDLVMWGREGVGSGVCKPKIVGCFTHCPYVLKMKYNAMNLEHVR